MTDENGEMEEKKDMNAPVTRAEVSQIINEMNASFGKIAGWIEQLVQKEKTHDQIIVSFDKRIQECEKQLDIVNPYPLEIKEPDTEEKES